MRAIDIVKPEPKTARGVWVRWANHQQSKLLTISPNKRIEVKYIEKIECVGQGRKYCEEQGQHSWFNHSQDSYYAQKY